MSTTVTRHLPFEARPAARPAWLTRDIRALPIAKTGASAAPQSSSSVASASAPDVPSSTETGHGGQGGAGSPAGAPLYVLRGIEKTFPGGVQALHGIDLDIREGEIFGIIGRSGAGKSTLLRVLNLLERPTQGSVQFDGRDLLALEPA